MDRRPAYSEVHADHDAKIALFSGDGREIANFTDWEPAEAENER
jgi:hypothetical protein